MQTIELAPSPALWKTVTVGNLHNAQTARERCQAAGITPTWGWQILDQMSFESTAASLNLACVTPKQLGLLGKGIELQAIFAAALKQGLSLCPPEVGPQLWMQHPDLPAYDQGYRPHLLIAMEPVTTDPERGYQKIFSLEHTVGTRWLDALAPDYMGRHWFEDTRFVFCLNDD